MVSVFSRIKFTTLRNNLGGGHVAMMMIGVILGLLLAAATILLAASQNSDTAVARNVLCLTLAVWTLGWVLGPILTGGDSTLRPEYFRTLPISAQRLTVGLLGATFIGIAPVVTLLAFCGLLLFANHLSLLALLVAVPALLLQVICTVLLSRVVGWSMGQAMRSRLGMEVGAICIGFLIAFLNVGWFAMPAVSTAVTSQTPLFSHIVQALPSGWSVTAIHAAHQKHWLLLVLTLGGLLLGCVALLLVWSKLLQRSSTGNQGSPTMVRPARHRLLPATPCGAVISKELRTWLRDPVRGRFLRMALWMAIFFGVLPALAGARELLPWIGPVSVLFATAFATNVYGFDGTALWLAITTPKAIAADVRGRQIAWLMIVAPISLMFSLLLVLVSGQAWGFGAIAVLLPVSLGVGSGVLVLFSILKIVPATDPHRRGQSIIISSEDMDSSQLQVLGLLSLMVLVLVTAACSVPGIIGVATSNNAWALGGIALSMAAGAVGYWLLGNLARKRLEHTAPELLLVMGKGFANTHRKASKAGKARRRWF